ncbi:glycosyltransferase [Candidatus Roizmanbacteria bacterium]|nr:glycosyltransferase [Candidatus Roizmanbacteria bacterium]
MKTFNSNNTLLVVSSYPDPKKGIRDLNAVAWHAQKTFLELSKHQKVIIFAEQLPHVAKKTKINKNLLILRTWKRGNPFSLLTLFFHLVSFREAEHVLFQFEFNIFGGILPVLVTPFLLALLRIAGKTTHFELHQVLFDVKEISAHINITNPHLQRIFNLGIRSFYRAVGFLSDTVIVLEEELKSRLSQFISAEKIAVLPLSVEHKHSTNSIAAKKRLGYTENDFVVLSFGFINWYKGSDWLVKTFQGVHDNSCKLLVAGGENPTLKDKLYYQTFIKKVHKEQKNNPNITFTGFIPDEKVSLYFAAADLVILPYRVFMSASGPFSLALSYKKPVILSENLLRYAQSEDIKYTFSELGLRTSDIFFKYSKKSCIDLMLKAKKDKKFYAKLQQFSIQLGKKRSIQSVVNKLSLIVQPKQYVSLKSTALPVYLPAYKKVQ